MGGNRHGTDVGSRSAVAIKLSVTMARFEITSGLFRPAPFRDQYARGSMLIKRLADIGKGELE